MLKLIVTFGLLLLSLGLLIFLKNDEIVYERTWPRVDKVSMVTPEQGAEHNWLWTIIGGYTDNCAANFETEVEYFSRNIDMQLYRDVPSGSDCANVQTPIEVEFAKDAATDGSYIIINDQVWRRVDNETDPAKSGSYVELSLMPVEVDNAALHVMDAENGIIQLRIRGNQAIGCALPEIYTLRETDAGAIVGVYNAISPDVLCPDMLMPVDETITLLATELPAETLFAVNSYLFAESETSDVSDNDRVLTNIFSVNVNVMESDPMRISLDVAGEHPDGCDYPVLVEQSRSGGSIKVQVYREVPADVICPMILKPYQGEIQLESEFEAGSYTVTVNSHTQTIDI